MRQIVLLLTLCTLLLISTPTARANTAAGKPVFFPETGHTLAYSFRDFYDRQGGLAIIGLPLSEVFLEDGRPVQYFERARLEWHADLGITLAGLLGHWVAEGRTTEPAFLRADAAPPGDTYFTETGHSLGGVFRDFWLGNGGLATFGYPISEPFVETNPQDGQDYTVQYFERARFEYHPANPAPYQVQLGHLGRQYLAAHPAPEWAIAPVQSAAQAWDALRPTHIRIPRIGLNTDVVSTGYSQGAWDVPRYTAAHYWPISAYPGTAGNIILAGHVGYRGIIFNQLPNIAVGDTISVNAGGQEHRYRVAEVLTLLPEETWVMQPTPTETLTMITCVPIGVYSHRLIVRAVPE
ncbi:sortase family protein [Oscillochloris trichoides DG-6]|uniref:Sortase family protein n=1 Tax=Oscillochloris trichoides DG-6 TaxID=765420 RepID=E1ICI6_9CHLR|nr:sortase [Oscillochloris trichoides]EFO81114.1 sortase family protein [Oscillochloris trichoides DG-6]